MTRLSLGVLCSKWLSPPRRFFGVLPKQFFTWVSQSPAVFWANGCCFRKGFVEGSAKLNILYICLPNGCCSIKSSLEGSANCALHLHISQSPPRLSWGQSCVNCWHVSPIQIQSAEKRPIMSLLLVILWVYFNSIGETMKCYVLILPISPPANHHLGQVESLLPGERYIASNRWEPGKPHYDDHVPYADWGKPGMIMFDWNNNCIILDTPIFFGKM